MVVVSNYMVSSAEVEAQHAQRFFQLLKEACKHLHDAVPTIFLNWDFSRM